MPGESHGQRSLVGYSHRVAKSWTQLSDLVCTHEAELLGSIGRWHPMLLQDQGELGLKMILGGLPWQVQWLRLCMSNAGGLDLTPGQRTKIPHDARHSTRCQCVDFSLLRPHPIIPTPSSPHLVLHTAPQLCCHSISRVRPPLTLPLTSQ